MTDKTYLTRYFEETDKVDHEAMIYLTDSKGLAHSMPFSVVVESILAAPEYEQEKIAGTIRRIDFHNGDVRMFLRHLARALAENYNGTLR